MIPSSNYCCKFLWFYQKIGQFHADIFIIHQAALLGKSEEAIRGGESPSAINNPSVFF